MNTKKIALMALAALVLAAAAILLPRGVAPAAESPVSDAVAAAGGLAGSADTEIVVYKSPTCGCCTGWVEHLREQGYQVKTVDIAEYQALAAKKAEQGVPNDLGSCHTAVVDGYTVEGHVPASVIARLLEERPDVRGIAVPGMPVGSPGMEGPNPQPYDVIAFRDDGSRVVFESVYPGEGAR